MELEYIKATKGVASPALRSLKSRKHEQKRKDKCEIQIPSKTGNEKRGFVQVNQSVRDLLNYYNREWSGAGVEVNPKTKRESPSFFFDFPFQILQQRVIAAICISCSTGIHGSDR